MKNYGHSPILPAITITWLALIVLNVSVIAQQERSGTISGVVTDTETKETLGGTNIRISGTNKGTSAELDGHFVLPGIKPGVYVLEFSSVGYSELRKTDIVVRPGRITSVSAEMTPSEVQTSEVVVRSGYFNSEKGRDISVTSFNYEEIRRAPGSAGDISRIIMGLPGLAKVDDQSNSLMVRGGSPIENAFYLDNIEIPNINHYPSQGSSGGPLGLINVDFIQDVSFSTGGFSASYGDRLSSVMEIAFREGNHSTNEYQLDLNFAGFGGVAEGPISGGKGSWMLSLRRSYLDLLIKAVDAGTSVAPVYGDYQGKAVYELNKNNKLTLLFVSGDDHSDSDQKTAFENDMIYYGNQDIYENTAGLNWRVLWERLGYSNTSVSYSSTKYHEDFYESGSASLLTQNHSLEESFRFRNVNHLRFSDINSLEFGVEAKHQRTDFNIFYASYTDATGAPSAPVRFDKVSSITKSAVFADYLISPTESLTLDIGLRADHFSNDGELTLSPRLSLDYKASPLISFFASFGIYTQSMPLILLAQNEKLAKLKSARAVHYIAGMKYLITEDIRLSLEVYRKNYERFPVNPSEPTLFTIDEIFYRYGFFFGHDDLIGTAKAYSQGLELMLQKKMARDFYGLTSLAWFSTKYRDQAGQWRNRVFDNRLIFSIEGGYKPSAEWDFSLRWIYAGGRPYTPFDLQASTSLNRSVVDESMTNQARYPDYHSLNVRVDRRFNYSGSNLVVYFSIWNVYNRKNVSSYFWNQKENRQDTISQWGMLPIFGLEYEF